MTEGVSSTTLSRARPLPEPVDVALAAAVGDHYLVDALGTGTAALHDRLHRDVVAREHAGHGFQNAGRSVTEKRRYSA